ncbi:adenylosuccinate lyase [candidate division WOR-3 bacterium]|uniref:Adenylosuccinate lyase n=1 Tax=candidate division WOR-3 bacterium TaxID=2052148 RepID=A0A938BSG4_UNCW3|nr:adenylosuccinate lyase [candidate division WOR-3 bacterium]
MTTRYDTPEMAALWNEDAKFRSWLLVEKTVAAVQAEIGIIPKTAARAIQRASFKIKEIDEFERITNHDVIAFTRSVAKSAAAAGKYVHYGLTSYDVVDTALSLRCASALEILQTALGGLRIETARLALEHKHTPMMGRTHGVHAEPITFGLKCLSWFEETERNIGRLAAAASEMRHGKISGVVGAYTQLGPDVEARVLSRLNLKPEPVSTQVIPRDRHAAMLNTLALVATGMERIATEIRNLQRTEVGELGEPFAKGQRGSSAMPHKKNPIICERITSLARLIRAYAQVGLENICLWHERDLSNSANERVIIPESFTLTHYMIRKLTGVLSGLVVRPDRMLANLESSGQTFLSQGVMLELVRAGMDKDRAYKLVQELAFTCQTQGGSLPELCAANPEISKLLDRRARSRAFDLKRLLRNVDAVYRRVGLTRRSKTR